MACDCTTMLLSKEMWTTRNWTLHILYSNQRNTWSYF